MHEWRLELYVSFLWWLNICSFTGCFRSVTTLRPSCSKSTGYGQSEKSVTSNPCQWNAPGTLQDWWHGCVQGRESKEWCG
jgi:hypothetical protein